MSEHREIIEQEQHFVLTEEQLQLLREMFQSNMVETTISHVPAEFKFEPFEITEDEFAENEKSDEFIEGKKLGVKWGSMYSTLLNYGVDIKNAGDLTVNQQSLEHQKELQEIINKGTEKQSLIAKQQTL